MLLAMHTNFMDKSNLKKPSAHWFIICSVICQSLSCNKIPYYNNHIEASITTKLILVYSYSTRCCSTKLAKPYNLISNQYNTKTNNCALSVIVLGRLTLSGPLVQIHLSSSFSLKGHGIHNL